MQTNEYNNIKKYNLYFNFFNRWKWCNKTIDQIKDIIFNRYSALIKHYNEKIYNNLRIDLLIDNDFSKLTYKHNNKNFISICEVKQK